MLLSGMDSLLEMQPSVIIDWKTKQPSFRCIPFQKINWKYCFIIFSCIIYFPVVSWSVNRVLKLAYVIFQDDLCTLDRFLPYHINALHSKHLVSLPCCNKRAFQLFFNCRKAKWSVHCSCNLAFLLQNTRGILTEL